MVSQQNTYLPSILSEDDIFAGFNQIQKSQIQKSIWERADSVFHDRDSNSGDALLVV